MSLERAKEILEKIQNKTATDEEKKLSTIAYNIVHANTLTKLGAQNV